MIQRGSGPGLALEALEGLVVPGQSLGQELESHKAAEPDVFGFIDQPHTASTQLVENPVVGNRLANHAPPRCRRKYNPQRKLWTFEERVWRGRVRRQVVMETWT